MKTQVLLLAFICSVFAIQVQGQSRTYVTARNSENSDNLDLRVVASIFGDSKDLYDFERRLNDPELQISNLDLNNDNRVDYLRVIESVENNTHVVIIQSVLDRDLYQDVATIEVEKDRFNKVHIQVVGNTYLFGLNYIYEPVYYNTPYIYASFWTPYYRPYYSSWTWNFYPSYYYAWNPFPVYRYRYNVSHCINTYNNYNYVNYRRSNNAVGIYNSNRSNGYEKQHPEYSFSRRNANVSNRYEYDQIRNTRNSSSRNETVYTQNKNNYPNEAKSQRGYSQNRNETSNATTPQRVESQRGYSQNRNETSSATTPQRVESQRGYSQNRNETSNAGIYQRNNTQNRAESPNVSSQRSESNKGNSQSRYSNTAENNTSSRRNNNRS
jgi:hypothetical protein